MNILITCAGGPAAVGVIKSINDFDSQGEHKVVAIDCDKLSVCKLVRLSGLVFLI